MGAQQFFVVEAGESAKDAFWRAVERARHEHGHAGYTGTIAEKDSFVVIPIAPGADPRELAQQMVDGGDPRVDDKWGPAGCFQLGAGRYFFFGWASS